MRLTSIMLAVLAVARTFADATADDTPKRSPELQVLDRFIGAWDEKVTINPMDGEEIKMEFVSRRRWTLGGTFLQIEDAHNLNDPAAKEFQLLWTYDPVAKNYPAVIMDGPNRAELTGTWDAKTTTMHWKGKSPDGGTSKGYHRFIGKDRAEAAGVFKDADGKVVMEISWPQTRRDETAKSSDTRALDTAPVGLTLPKDGSWATYQFEGAELGNQESGTGTFRIVGTTTEADQKCRWIEMQINENGKSSLLKILVREKDLTGIAKPISVLRGWKKVGEKVTRVVDGDKAEMEMSIGMFFGNAKDAKTIDSEKVVKRKRSQLKVTKATRGTMNFPQGLQVTRTVWRHEGVPFGMVAFDLSVKSGDKPVFEMKATLKDHGTGAKSALPENN